MDSLLTRIAQEYDRERTREESHRQRVITIRLSPELHAWAKDTGHRCRTSMNLLLVALIAAGLEQVDRELADLAANSNRPAELPPRTP